MKWLAQSNRVFTQDGKLLAVAKSVDDARNLVKAHNEDVAEKPEFVENKGRVEGVKYKVVT